MKKLEQIKGIIREHKKEIEEKFKVKNLALFGSYVNDEQSENSDIDILVEFKEPVGFLFIHLAEYLEKILETKVDLLTPEAIKPNRKEYILKKLIYV